MKGFLYFGKKLKLIRKVCSMTFSRYNKTSRGANIQGGLFPDWLKFAM